MPERVQRVPHFDWILQADMSTKSGQTRTTSQQVARFLSKKMGGSGGERHRNRPTAKE